MTGQRMNCPKCTAPLDNLVPNTITQCQYCQTSVKVPAEPPPPDKLENLYSELNVINGRWESIRSQWKQVDGSDPSQPIMSYPYVFVPLIVVTLLFITVCFLFLEFPFGPGLIFMAAFVLYGSLHGVPHQLQQFREFEAAKSEYLARRQQAEERIQKRIEAAQQS